MNQGDEYPSRKLQPKKSGLFEVKSNWTNTPLLDIKGNAELVFIDCRSVEVRADEIPTSSTDSTTQSSLNPEEYTGECDVDKIVGHDVVNKKTLCGVIWYGYRYINDTTEPEEKLLRHFIAAYWSRLNR